MRVYLIVFMPDYEGIRKTSAKTAPETSAVSSDMLVINFFILLISNIEYEAILLRAL